MMTQKQKDMAFRNYEISLRQEADHLPDEEKYTVVYASLVDDPNSPCRVLDKSRFLDKKVTS